jgi:hypothetical protein
MGQIAASEAASSLMQRIAMGRHAAADRSRHRDAGEG